MGKEAGGRDRVTVPGGTSQPPPQPLPCATQMHLLPWYIHHFRIQPFLQPHVPWISTPLVAFSAGSMWEGAFGGHLPLLLLVCYLGPHPVGLLAPSFQLLAPNCLSSSMSSHPCTAQASPGARGGPQSAGIPKGSWILCPSPAPFPGPASILS